MTRIKRLGQMGVDLQRMKGLLDFGAKWTDMMNMDTRRHDIGEFG